MCGRDTGIYRVGARLKGKQCRGKLSQAFEKEDSQGRESEHKNRDYHRNICNGRKYDTQTRYCFGCAYRLGSAYKRKSQCAYVFYVFACGVKALRPDAGLAFESCGNHCDAHERCENERNFRLPRSDRE